jgi:hypothetical protein
MQAYNKNKGEDDGQFRFIYRFQRLSPDDTAASLLMKDGDVIESFKHMTGD